MSNGYDNCCHDGISVDQSFKVRIGKAHDYLERTEMRGECQVSRLLRVTLRERPDTRPGIKDGRSPRTSATIACRFQHDG